MQKRWKCTVCGQIFEGERPPVPCPVCGAGEDAFVPLDAPENAKWKCLVCGQIFEGPKPPAPCPICGAGADAFVPVEARATAFRRDSVERFVIVGGGIAALEAAKAIRERNATGLITMICGEGVIPYNRPALSDVVGDGYSFEAIAVEDMRFYAQQNIQLVLDARAVKVDAAAREVLLSDGRRLPYDQLLLATGANAFNPVRAKEGAVPCHCLRTFADALDAIERCRGRRALVVGGGILGLEAAVALRELQAQVTVVELGERILAMQADGEASARLKVDLEALGLNIQTGKTVQELTADGALLTDGSFVAADFVLVSIGVRSEVALAKEMGLAVNRGIAVDEAMRTGVPNVYAAGDCAEYAGRVAGLWNVAAAQGKVAGAAMAGDEAAYAPPIAATAFETAGIRFFSAGTFAGEHLTRYAREDGFTGATRRLYFKGGRLCGTVFYGDVRQSGAALTLIERGAPFADAAALLN